MGRFRARTSFAGKSRSTPAMSEARARARVDREPREDFSESSKPSPFLRGQPERNEIGSS